MKADGRTYAGRAARDREIEIRHFSYKFCLKRDPRGSGKIRRRGPAMSDPRNSQSVKARPEIVGADRSEHWVMLPRSYRARGLPRDLGNIRGERSPGA